MIKPCQGHDKEAQAIPAEPKHDPTKPGFITAKQQTPQAENTFRYEFKQLAVYENGRTPVLLTEAEYNHAKLCVDACAGIIDSHLIHVIDSGGWKAISAQWIQNLANANERSEILSRELNNWIEKTTAAYKDIEQQRDELLAALQEIATGYIVGGTSKDTLYQCRQIASEAIAKARGNV